jgi:hypothetical protein
MTVSSLKPQVEQVLTFKPLSTHVALFVVSHELKECQPVAAIVCFSTYPQDEHALSFSPAVAHVAAVVVFQELNECLPVAAIVCVSV